MFQFTPLLGAQSASPASQSLLELDGGVKILIDVGWDDDFDVEKLEELERWVTCAHRRAPKVVVSLVPTTLRLFVCYKNKQ